jgi:hypothetical protein
VGAVLIFGACRYLGLNRRRLSGRPYLHIMDEFMHAVRLRWPQAVIQFEDFETKHAEMLLVRSPSLCVRCVSLYPRLSVSHWFSLFLSPLASTLPGALPEHALLLQRRHPRNCLCRRRRCVTGQVESGRQGRWRRNVAVRWPHTPVRRTACESHSRLSSLLSYSTRQPLERPRREVSYWGTRLGTAAGV